MIRQAFDREELGAYVRAVRAHLDAPEMQAAAGRASAALGIDVSTRLPDVMAGRASSGGGSDPEVPYLARDRMQSLLQSALEEKLRAHGVRDETPGRREDLSRIVHCIESILDPVRFGPHDPRWVIDVGTSMFERLAAGTHPFNPRPAERTIGDGARLVVVGDWASGLPAGPGRGRLHGRRGRRGSRPGARGARRAPR